MLAAAVASSAAAPIPTPIHWTTPWPQRPRPKREAVRDDAACISVLNDMGIHCKNLQRHGDSVAHFERALALAEGRGDNSAAPTR